MKFEFYFVGILTLYVLTSCKKQIVYEKVEGEYPFKISMEKGNVVLDYAYPKIINGYPKMNRKFHFEGCY